MVAITGVDCLHIRASRANQKLKAKSSERLVPIHSKLKTLGFIELSASSGQQGMSEYSLTCRRKHGYAVVSFKWSARIGVQMAFEGKRNFHRSGIPWLTI